MINLFTEMLFLTNHYDTIKHVKRKKEGRNYAI